jgi:hypothetical protein
VQGARKGTAAHTAVAAVQLLLSTPACIHLILSIHRHLLIKALSLIVVEGRVGAVVPAQEGSRSKACMHVLLANVAWRAAKGPPLQCACWPLPPFHAIHEVLAVVLIGANHPLLLLLLGHLLQLVQRVHMITLVGLRTNRLLSLLWLCGRVLRSAPPEDLFTMVFESLELFSSLWAWSCRLQRRA